MTSFWSILTIYDVISRAIGYYGTHAEQQYEKKQFKQAARWKKHHALALGIKNNKTMMTHFKRRDGFCQ